MDEENRHKNDEPYAPDEEPKIGDVLARARRERGLSLQEVEQATKIRKRYISGLENEDYSSLPDTIYVQGFLKTYANYLGLDGDELARELRRRRGRRREKRQKDVGEIRTSDFERPALGPGGLSKAQGRRIAPTTLLTLVIAVVALGAVVSALYFIGSESQTADSPDSPPEQEAPAGDSDSSNDLDPENDSANGNSGNSNDSGSSGSSEAGDSTGASESNGDSAEDSGGEDQNSSSGSGGDGEEASVEPGTLAVTVSVAEAESWISVSSDGVISYEQIAPPGFSETFEAEEDILLSTGNAGALTVEVNGQDIGPVGDDGEVVLDRSFTLKDAS